MSDPQFPGGDQPPAPATEETTPASAPPQVPDSPPQPAAPAWASPATKDAAPAPGWTQPAPTPAWGQPPAQPTQPAAPAQGWTQPAPTPAWGQPPAQPTQPAAPAQGWTQPAQDAAPAPAWGQSPAQPTQPAAPAQGWTQPAPAPSWGQPPAQPTQPAAPAAWTVPPASAPAGGQPAWNQGQPAPGYPGGPPAPGGYNQAWAGAAAQPYRQPGHYMMRGLVAGLFLLLTGLLTLVVSVVFVTGGAIFGGFVNDALRQYGVAIDELGGTGSTDVLNAAGNVVTGVLVFFGVLIGLYGLITTFGGLGTLLRRGWGRVLGIIATILVAPFLTFTLLGSFSVISGSQADVSGVGGGGFVALAIIVGVVVLYWFTLFALITGGAHFRRG